jgi:hypothetical protein
MTLGIVFTPLQSFYLALEKLRALDRGFVFLFLPASELGFDFFNRNCWVDALGAISKTLGLNYAWVLTIDMIHGLLRFPTLIKTDSKRFFSRSNCFIKNFDRRPSESETQLRIPLSQTVRRQSQVSVASSSIDPLLVIDLQRVELRTMIFDPPTSF